MPATRIKICCIARVEEGLAAVEHGAWAVGLVSEMPSGPGVISEALIAEIAAALPASVMTFLLTSRQDAAEIIAQQRRCRVTTVQICDRVDVPVFLAGGLTPENVADAVRRVRPFGVALGPGTPRLPPDPDYPGHVEVRRERTSGEIKSQGRLVFRSEPLASELVGIEPIDHGIWSNVFTTTLLTRFDERTRLIVE
jgi:hypothetical protein